MLRTALDPAIARLLEDPSVVEVMLNPDGRLWIDRLSEGLSDTGERLSAASRRRSDRRSIASSFICVGRRLGRIMISRCSSRVPTLLKLQIRPHAAGGKSDFPSWRAKPIWVKRCGSIMAATFVGADWAHAKRAPVKAPFSVTR